MANEENKISYKDLNMSDGEIPSGDIVTIEFGGLAIAVKPYLSLTEMMQFVADVIRDCYIGANEVYYPEVKHFNITRNIINKYTNLEMPTDASELYEYTIKLQSLTRKIVGIVDRRQFDEMMIAIDDKIDTINTVRENNITKQVNELYGMLDNLSTQFSGVFDGIDVDDVRDLVGALSGVHLDEERLVKAIAGQKE